MLNEMLGALSGFLPPSPSPTLPPAGVSVVNLTERTVGLGNRVGLETRGPFGVAVLRSSRFDAVVRFQVWARQPNETDDLITILQTNLLAATANLRAQGFLRFAVVETSPATFNPVLGIWGKTSDYSVLYEFSLPPDTDGAESLIARVPIHVNGDFQEQTVATGLMVRWDNQSAPSLMVRRRTIQSLSALVFIPGVSLSDRVILTRTFDGATGVPTSFDTITDFKTAVMGLDPSDRHAQIRFASLDAFLSEFSSAGDPITLGDWDEDGVPDQYQSRRLEFESKIYLPSAGDRLEIALENSPLNDIAVIYLRAA